MRAVDVLITCNCGDVVKMINHDLLVDPKPCLVVVSAEGRTFVTERGKTVKGTAIIYGTEKVTYFFEAGNIPVGEQRRAFQQHRCDIWAYDHPDTQMPRKELIK